jgi:hypothetical protein
MLIMMEIWRKITDDFVPKILLGFFLINEFYVIMRTLN